MPINFPNLGLKQVKANEKADEYTAETVKAFGLAFINTFRIPHPSEPNLMPTYLAKCGKFFIEKLHNPNTRAPEELCRYFLHQNEVARLRTSTQTKHRDFSFQNNASVESWFFQSSRSPEQLHERMEQNRAEDMEEYQKLIDAYFDTEINLCLVLHQAYANLCQEHFKSYETIILNIVNEENVMVATLNIIGQINQFDYLLAQPERRWGLEIIGYLKKTNLDRAIDSPTANNMLNLYEGCGTSDEINELTLNIIEKHISEPFKKKLQVIREEIDKFNSSPEIQAFQKIFTNFLFDAQKNLSNEEITDKINLLHTCLNINFIALETLTLQQEPLAREQAVIANLIFDLKEKNCMETLTDALSELGNTDIDLASLHLTLDEIVWIGDFYESLAKQPLSSEELDALSQADNFLKEHKIFYKKNSTDYEQLLNQYLNLYETNYIEQDEYQKISSALDKLIDVLSKQKVKLNKYIESLKINDPHKDSPTFKLLIKIFGIELSDLEELSNQVTEQAETIRQTLRNLTELDEEEFSDSAANSPVIDFKEYKKESKEEETTEKNPHKKRKLNSPKVEFTKEEKEEEEPEFSAAFSS